MQQTNYMPSHSEGQYTKKSNIWTLILMCSLFAMPFVLGAVLYCFRDTVHLQSNSRGEVLQPRLAKEVLNFSFDHFLGKWQLLYLSPLHCNEDCQKNTKLLENLCLALGKDTPRVVLRTLPFSESNKVLHSTGTSSFSSFTFSAGSVVIVDPQGWLVTHYRPTHFHAKGILDDLRRLMRYSYVG